MSSKQLYLSKKKKNNSKSTLYISFKTTFHLFFFFFLSIFTLSRLTSFCFSFCFSNLLFFILNLKRKKKKSYYKTIIITSHLYSLNLVTTAYPYLNTPHFNSNSNRNNFKNLELHQYIFISTSFLLILFNFEKNSAGTHQNDALLERR